MAVAGAVGGVAWYIWYHKIWKEKMFPEDSMAKEAFAYGIFTSIGMSALFAPTYWPHGFLIGGLIGNFY